MIFSIYNSFDNERQYSSLTRTLPYYGLYESCANKKTIFIYCLTVRNDTLTIQYSNSKENTAGNYTKSEVYTINNTEKKINLNPCLNYYRIYLTSTDGSYDSSYRRIFNVYLCESQILLTDTDGKLLTTSSGTSTVAFDNTQYDAFGRIRISQPLTLFDSANVNYKNTKFSDYTNGVGNTITYNHNGSFVNLICNVSGSVVREGKTICSYQPGKSLLILNTFVMNSPVTGLTQRVGYYNDRNGIFLELDGSTLNIAKYSYSSGALIETRIPQADWNTNELLSGTPTLDMTKPQIFWIDIEWLGVGDIRTGFIIGGQYYICHIFRHANASSGTYGTYMTSARLAPRYEIIYNGVGSSLGYTLKQVCSSVISEGGYDAKSIVRHIGNEVNMTNIPTSGAPSNWLPLIAIKLDDTSSVNINGIMIPAQMSVLYFTGNSKGNLLYNILLNPTITGNGATPTYTKYSTTYSSDTNSVVSYWVNTNASGSVYSVSGGIVVNAGLLANDNTVTLGNSTDFNVQIGRNYVGNNTYTSDILVLAVKLLSFGNSPELYSQIGWYEI